MPVCCLYLSRSLEVDKSCKRTGRSACIFLGSGSIITFTLPVFGVGDGLGAAPNGSADLLIDGAVAAAAAADVDGAVAAAASAGLLALLSAIGFDFPPAGPDEADAVDTVPLVGGAFALLDLLGVAIGFLLLNFLCFSKIKTIASTMTITRRAPTPSMVIKIQFETSKTKTKQIRFRKVERKFRPKIVC